MELVVTTVENEQEYKSGGRRAMASQYKWRMERIPFDKLPQDAADVQIFSHMPNPLMSCRKIEKKGHKIILNDSIATVINEATNEVVMEAVFDDQTSTWNIYPDGPVEYKFKKEEEVDSLGLGVQQQEQSGYIIHLANNAYRLTTKKEIVEYYHAAAGWPVKKTWIAAIQRNAYTFASWLGLTKYMVRRHLEVREPTVLGHMNARSLGTQTTKKKKKKKIWRRKIGMHPS